jgi:hypothetical protein
MEDNTQRVLNHGRRQKRLQYWLAQFSAAQSTSKSSHGQAIREKLETYRLLLARKLKATAEHDIAETEDRIFSLERELEASFEDLRLAPSAIGEVNRCLDPKV